MSALEQAPRFEEVPDFGMGLDMGEFDINAAFQEAIQVVASDTELALEEKVRRMEVIISEGTSEVYRDFVSFGQMAAQMEMICNHDHELNQSMQGNDMHSSFLNSHRPDEGHGHHDGWKYKLELSDEFVSHHHHVSCLRCGTVVDIQDEEHIDAFIQEVAQRIGFKPRRHQFEIDGYCKNCM